MILNEDYFKDLELNDEDITANELNDIEKTDQVLTVEYVRNLHKQYDDKIKIAIYNNELEKPTDIVTKTSALSKSIKILDTILDLYCIDHSEYILTATEDTDKVNYVINIGNHQVFLYYDQDYYMSIDGYLKDQLPHMYVNVYVKYPKFNHKSVFRYMYALINNIFRRVDYIDSLCLSNSRLTQSFYLNISHLIVCYFDNSYSTIGSLYLWEEQSQSLKHLFYKSVMLYFGKDADIDYEANERDVPLKPIVL